MGQTSNSLFHSTTRNSICSEDREAHTLEVKPRKYLGVFNIIGLLGH